MTAIMDLAQARCLNHPQREAAARCPGCGHDYCRECVAEHAGQVLCAGCLLRRTPAARTAARRGRLSRWLAATLGLLIAWLCFYLVARGLLLLPDTFFRGASAGQRPS